MIAALFVMLLVGFAMGVAVCEILVARPARELSKQADRDVARAVATAQNWERVADRTMAQTWRVDADNLDHSKAAELRVVES